jgi:hypothetical protein
MDLLHTMRDVSASFDPKVCFDHGPSSQTLGARPCWSPPCLSFPGGVRCDYLATPYLSVLGLGTLGSLVKRAGLQDQHRLITSQGPQTYTAVLEELGDPQERVSCHGGVNVSRLLEFLL